MLYRSVDKESFKAVICLLSFWLIATAYNLFKPFHIDDTAHLEIAKWIMSNPLHPLSGPLNWGGVEEPIFATNQPHLFFYILAVYGYLFGFSEPAMHLLQSLATLASVLLFYRLAHKLSPDLSLWMTAMLILGPAFIVGQNLMVDTALLATWLLFFNALICDVGSPKQNTRFFIASLACSAALLIKYSSAVLFPILLISIVMERRWKQFWLLLIPIVALVSWSAFNYLDFGQIHILGRKSGHDLLHSFGRAVAWLLALGSITPLGLLLLTSWWRRYSVLIFVSLAAAFALLVIAVAQGWLSDSISDAVLWGAFAISGIVIAACLLVQLKKQLERVLLDNNAISKNEPEIYLFAWIIFTTAFYCVFAPFIASRHVLLIVPPILLLLCGPTWRSAFSAPAKIFGLCFTIVVSVGLCVSDWQFASFYKREAAALAHELPKNATVWTTGHWGWQWYADLNGFRQADVRELRLQPGFSRCCG